MELTIDYPPPLTFTLASQAGERMCEMKKQRQTSLLASSCSEWGYGLQPWMQQQFDMVLRRFEDDKQGGRGIRKYVNVKISIQNYSKEWSSTRLVMPLDCGTNRVGLMLMRISKWAFSIVSKTVGVAMHMAEENAILPFYPFFGYFFRKIVAFGSDWW